MRIQVSTTLILIILCSIGYADTFTDSKSGQVYHGYVTTLLSNGNYRIQTPNQGLVDLSLTPSNIQYNEKGRNNHIALFSIDGEIASELETTVIEETIGGEASRGPLFILFELDTPGGRIDLTKRICNAITDIHYCKIIAYIKGGDNGGAYSAGAVISLACDEIYMNSNTSMGAATMIASNGSRVMDMKEALGEVVGEKYNSAWRNYVASIAESNQYPGALGKAMVDKDIAVLEVKRNNQSFFLEPKDKKPTDKLVKVFCQEGKILTLTPEQALYCGLSSGIVESRQILLKQLNALDSPVIENQTLQDARQELEKVIRRFEKLKDNITNKAHEIQAKGRHGGITVNQAKKDFMALIKNTQYLINLKKKYPDVPTDEEDLQELLSKLKAEYNAIRSIRR